MRGSTTIDVFTYLDYREFLRDYYQDRKTFGRGFSYRAFSARAGLRSPNYLKLIIDGQRNLTQGMAKRFADACGLRGESTAYFCDLVQFSQASDADRGEHYDKLLAFRRYREAHRLQVAQAAYHSKWYLPAIRELALCRGFRDDPAWIARTMVPSITEQEAKEALETLKELGLLVRDETGRLVQRDVVVSTGPEIQKVHIATYHRIMMGRAGESIDLLAPQDRDISAVTLVMASDGIARLKARLREIRKELVEMSCNEADPEQVVQVNLQVFPLSRVGKTGGGVA